MTDLATLTASLAAVHAAECPACGERLERLERKLDELNAAFRSVVDTIGSFGAVIERDGIAGLMGAMMGGGGGL